MPEIEDFKLDDEPLFEGAGGVKQKRLWTDSITAVRKTRLTQPRTLTICGYAHLSRHLADYDKRTHEIWGCNEAYSADYMTTSGGEFRTDRWFQMHLREDWGRLNNPNDPNHPDWIKAKHNFPIVMQEKHDDAPSSEAFPLDECDELFFKNAYSIGMDGTIVPWLERYEHGYYSSSFVWMLAYALWQKATGKIDWQNIDIYGFHVNSQSEYMHQKPGAEFWLSRAMGMDINVRIVENSPLLHGKLYGYEIGDALLPSHIERRMDELGTELPRLKEEAHQHHGARLMVSALRDKPEYLEALPDLNSVYNVRQQEELTATAKVNFYLAAESNSRDYLRALRNRDGSFDGATGSIDRMTLEVQKHGVREMVIETRASLDAVSGALSECRLNQAKFAYDSEIKASFRQREVKLINKLIERTGQLNNLLGLVSNIDWFIMEAEGRTPNFTDDHDFGFIVIPDLFDPNTDVLTLGEKTDEQKGQEKQIAAEEIPSGTEGDVELAGESG